MSIKERDLDILELEKKYEKLGNRLEYVVGEIEDLESEQNVIEYDTGEIEKQIDAIKKEMLGARIETLNIETDDVFTNDFMKASYFTSRTDSTRPSLQTVNIKKNELWALDGYRAIIITNNDIPIELQNTNISWDTRENFKDNIIDLDLNFIDARSVFPKKEEAKYIIHGVNFENFNDIFKPEECKMRKTDTVKLHYEDFVIAAKGEFLNDALMILKGKTFTIYFFTSVTPILIECENIEIIILPVRLINKN